MIKLALCDFDGTLTKVDVLDCICDYYGHGNESRIINEAFIKGEVDGATALKRRFSLIVGAKIAEIEDNVLRHIPLTDGAKEFFQFARRNRIRSVIISGNAQFVLDYYQKVLGFDEYYCSLLNVSEGIVMPWDDSTCQCVRKDDAVRRVMDVGKYTKADTIAIGDAPVDEIMFSSARQSYLINSKGYSTIAKPISSMSDIIHLMDKEH